MKSWKKVIFLGLLVILPVTYTVAKQADQKKEKVSVSDEIIAKIGDKKLTLAEVQVEFSRIPPQFASHFNSLEKKEQYVKNMVDRSLFSMEAREMGFMENEEVRAKIEGYVDRILYAEYMKKMTKGLEVTDAECLEYYNQNKAEFSDKEKIKASHILVGTEEEALKIKKELDDGADWNDLVKKDSADKSNRNKGGDLGYFARGRMAGEFDNVAFSMKIGEIRGPVKTNFGYHIIKLVDKKPEKMQPYDKVKTKVKNTLTSNKRKEKLEKIRQQLFKKYDVVIYSDKINDLKVGGGRRGMPGQRGRTVPVQLQKKPLVKPKTETKKEK